MPLLLCRQKASFPFRHEELNLNIWTIEELSFLIYNYPYLCMGGFLSEGLFEWIEKGLKLKELSASLRSGRSARESQENQLVMILRECNYYDAAEIMNLKASIREFLKRDEWEQSYLKGRTLFAARVYNQAGRLINEAIRKQELEYRRTEPHDDASLRAHNLKKADMYCDVACCRLQLFDEKGAKELLTLSESTFKNERALRLRYLLDGSGDIDEETKRKLDLLKDKALKDVTETEEYKKTLEFLSQEESVLFPAAKKMVAKWKKEYRKI